MFKAKNLWDFDSANRYYFNYSAQPDTLLRRIMRSYKRSTECNLSIFSMIHLLLKADANPFMENQRFQNAFDMLSKMSDRADALRVLNMFLGHIRNREDLIDGSWTKVHSTQSFSKRASISAFLICCRRCHPRLPKDVERKIILQAVEYDIAQRTEMLCLDRTNEMAKPESEELLQGSEQSFVRSMLRDIFADFLLANDLQEFGTKHDMKSRFDNVVRKVKKQAGVTVPLRFWTEFEGIELFKQCLHYIMEELEIKREVEMMEKTFSDSTHDSETPPLHQSVKVRIDDGPQPEEVKLAKREAISSFLMHFRKKDDN